MLVRGCVHLADRRMATVAPRGTRATAEAARRARADRRRVPPRWSRPMCGSLPRCRRRRRVLRGRTRAAPRARRTRQGGRGFSVALPPAPIHLSTLDANIDVHVIDPGRAWWAARAPAAPLRPGRGSPGRCSRRRTAAGGGSPRRRRCRAARRTRDRPTTSAGALIVRPWSGSGRRVPCPRTHRRRRRRGASEGVRAPL